MVKYTIEEAFEELKKRAEWIPPEDYNTVEKFLSQVIRDLEGNCISSSEYYLIRLFGRILDE